MIRATLLLALNAVIFLGGCAATPQTTQRALNPGTDWVANSSGWIDEAMGVYEQALQYVLASGPPHGEGRWAVIMDLDETVLNNVQYQVRLELAGESYTPQSWYQWTQEQAATLVPGARKLIMTVKEAGGHVAFVTNRKDHEQLATENNLAQLGLVRGDHFRALLTRATPAAPGNKQARFDLVTDLLRVQGYPDVQIVAYFGDNVGDKPEESGLYRFFCIDQGAMYGEPCAKVPGPGE